MLCALLVSAFAAQSASAITGTTAFTCSKSADVKDRFGEHCLATGTPKEYGHIPITQDVTTELKVSNEKSANETKECSEQRLKTTIGGVATELTSCLVEGEGSPWIRNRLDASGEHYTESHFTLTYTNVKVAKPAGVGCVINTDNADKTVGTAGIVHTEPLKGTTLKQGDSVKLEPTTGTTFANFHITGCTGAFAAINATYSVTGSITCKPDGATINCNHNEITTQNTLKLNGSVKAGYEGSTTLSGRLDSSQAYTPLSTTTVTT